MISIHIEGEASELAAAFAAALPHVAAFIPRRVDESLAMAQRLQALETQHTALRDVTSILATRETNMADQAAQIRSLMKRYDDASNEIARDISGLIAKVRAGAPNLLTDAELAQAEASVTRLEALGRETDPALVGPDAGAAPGTGETTNPSNPSADSGANPPAGSSTVNGAGTGTTGTGGGPLA